ncbi:HlyD family secretion protein [Spirulina subsalsa FACHB-351]|uniref:HlyD family secretion protein n=1 Tax=Spirulina subsalsa FACHB-351 TaxID=234711 RepID=A0ABT3L2X2_9CYAN|nr:HlyD family secretion protein [Spirulina subsalsa]MCW6035828.1 HlyD family secretion protein [Spirulina subsalsa FACHB-351]
MSQSLTNPTTFQEETNSTQGKKRLKHLTRNVLYLVGGVGLIGAVWVALRPSPVLVDIATVERDALQVTVNAEGRTRLQSRYTVSAAVAGNLRRVQLDEGDRIQQGQVIARIDPLPLTSQVRSSQARLQELQAQREGVATLRPKQEELAQVRSQISGLEAQKQAAQARVEQAKANLDQATRDRQRIAGLVTSGALPRQQLEEAELAENTRRQDVTVAERERDRITTDIAAQQAEITRLQAEQRDPDYQLRVYDAQIASVQAELTRLTEDAIQTVIKSPVSGQVLRILEKSDRHIAAGTPILELGNTGQLELVIDVLSSDAVRIQPGNQIILEHWGGEQPLTAQVRYLEPSAFTKVSALGVEEQRVNVIADILNPPPQLGDGYRVDAKIVVWDAQDVLTLPISALFRCEQQAWCTFVVEEGKAVKTPVEVGQRGEFAAVIREGVSEGDQVILHPSAQIQHETLVAPR